MQHSKLEMLNRQIILPRASDKFINYCRKSVVIYINSLRNVITSTENEVHEMEIFPVDS